MSQPSQQATLNSSSPALASESRPRTTRASNDNRSSSNINIRSSDSSSPGTTNLHQSKNQQPQSAGTTIAAAGNYFGSLAESSNHPPIGGQNHFHRLDQIEKTKENQVLKPNTDTVSIRASPALGDTGTNTNISSSSSSSSGGGSGSNNIGLARATNNRRFDQFGEENILRESSLDRVIIGSSQRFNASDTVSGELQAIAAGDSCEPLHKTSALGNSGADGIANLINIGDKFCPSSPESTAQLAAPKLASPHSHTNPASGHHHPADSKRFRYKGLLDSVVTISAAAATLATTPTATVSDKGSGGTPAAAARLAQGGELAIGQAGSGSALTNRISEYDESCDTYELDTKNQERIQLNTLHSHEEGADNQDDQFNSEEDEDNTERTLSGLGRFETFDGRELSSANSSNNNHSTFRRQTGARFLSGGNHVLVRIQKLLGIFNSKLFDNYKETPYVPYEGKDLLTGNSKYSLGRKKHHPSGGGGGSSKTFRGSYKYSRAHISMAIFKKLINSLVQRSTLALLGAFLIHITLGTVYTLSNINSYLTSYMRLHGSPTATYGGSMWISSFYAIGQGFSMVLGGYLEKRFSARLACFLGCLLHSSSIMSTSWSINHGSLAVLFTYGFMPGFGCGLAYMTPMSNGFGWFPNRRGLVAGVILAGFGIGTFVFNIAQTAYVNPDNLSPPPDSSGYFTQDSILTKVPGLFLFIGSIYAAMQFVGCCLLFKPPSQVSHSYGKSPLDERPILESEVSVGRAIRTREFMVLFLVYGIITQGVLFVNSMIKEYGQIFIGDDMYLAWTGSMASIANALGRLVWGLAIDRFTFTQCFTCITSIFALLMFLMPFEFILSSKALYLVCTLGIFGSFSGWMSTFPVHLSRTFGRLNSGMIYGLIFISQSFGGIASAFGAHYLIDHYNRFVPFFCVVFLEILGLAIYHLFYPKHRYL